MNTLNPIISSYFISEISSFEKLVSFVINSNISPPIFKFYLESEVNIGKSMPTK